MTITAYASATMANNSSSSHVTQQQQQRQRTTRQQQRQRLRQSRARTKSAAQITLTSTSTLTPLLKRAISAPQWIFLFILIFAATGKDVCLCVCMWVSQDTWDINVVEIESERERWNFGKQQQTRSAQVFRWAHYIFNAFRIMFVYLCTCTTIVSEYEQHRPKYSTYAWLICVCVYLCEKGSLLRFKLQHEIYFGWVTHEF